MATKISTVTGRRYRVHGTGKDARGNSRDRRARRLYLLSEAAGFGGDGCKVPCVHCKAMVDMATMHVDREIPESAGGRYTRDNIQPACGPCNITRSDDMDWVSKIVR